MALTEVKGAAGLKRDVAAAYDAQADEFAAYAETQVYGHVCRPLAEVLAAFGGPVLDVASGTGALARQLPDAVALDLSFGQLHHNDTRRRVCADAEQLPFDRDTFAAAGCAFGLNHFPDPVGAVSEMARVAGVVGVVTWVRPEAPFLPRQLVFDVIQAYAGQTRSPVGRVVERMTDAMGSAGAVRSVFTQAGLRSRVWTEEAEVPWPGAAAFVNYRLSMPSVRGFEIDRDAVRRDALNALSGLSPEQLTWRPRLVVALGRRRAS